MIRFATESISVVNRSRCKKFQTRRSASGTPRLLPNKDLFPKSFDPAIRVLFDLHQGRSKRGTSGMKLIFKLCFAIAALALSSVASASAGLAELRNGFVVHLDHRETRGNVSRLFLDAGSENYVDVPSDQIVGFEETIELPAPPAWEPVHTPSLEEIVAAASYRYGIDPDVVFSLIRAESAFNPKAVSPKGAQGLMQLMPQTATLLGVENSLDAAANVDGGTRYLRNLLVQYNQDLTKALAAYNAGPARVQQFHGVPPYPETIAYINRVVGDLNHRKLAKSAFAFQLARKKGNDQTFKP